MRKPYVTEAPVPPGLVTGSSVGAGQTLPPDEPRPPQAPATSAATSGSARLSRTRSPFAITPSPKVAREDKKEARSLAQTTCKHWASQAWTLIKGVRPGLRRDERR